MNESVGHAEATAGEEGRGGQDETGANQETHSCGSIFQVHICDSGIRGGVEKRYIWGEEVKQRMTKQGYMPSMLHPSAFFKKESDTHVVVQDDDFLWTSRV